MGAHNVIEHRRPIAKQVKAIVPEGVNYVLAPTCTEDHPARSRPNLETSRSHRVVEFDLKSEVFGRRQRRNRLTLHRLSKVGFYCASRVSVSGQAHALLDQLINGLTSVVTATQTASYPGQTNKV
jgi:hypothetical protein